MLVNSNNMLSTALKEGYAVPAYNINNLELTKFILEACNEDKSPVILAVSATSITYFGGAKVVYSVVNSLIKELDIKVPVVLHLDHGPSVEICKEAIDAGFTSVMIDSSRKVFEENVADTLEVVNYAKDKNISVESELGAIEKGSFTSVDEAKDFVLQTGINSLAPAIGNYHGIYKGEPELNFELLGEICKYVKTPIVLHGASGLDNNKIKTAVFCGVTKINIDTDIRVAWTHAVRNFLEYDKEVYDIRKIIKSGEKAVKKVVHEKNELFGSKNRA